VDASARVSAWLPMSFFRNLPIKATYSLYKMWPKYTRFACLGCAFA
jgi:hypothetical protein